MPWEVDWSHPGNTGAFVWARNPTGHLMSSREWHWIQTGHLRKMGIPTPVYRKDSWEIDWTKRNIPNKKVWARNQYSKMPNAREWHWIDQKTVEWAGFRWKPARTHIGRLVDARGYVVLNRMGMTDDDIAFSEAQGLFRGRKKSFVKEHHLVAARKYGGIPAGYVVRHLNGNKEDNSPDNLALGSPRENQMDHETARAMMMYWRHRCEELEHKLAEISANTPGEGDC